MRTCCIEGCEISSKKDVTLFEFPTSRLHRKRWLDAISPAGKLPADALVCSRHFASADYEDVRGKIRLKSKVVPSLFGKQAHTPKPLKDPLGLADSEESQEGTEKQELRSNIDNHNGNVDNHNGNVDNHNGNDDKHNKKVEDHTENVANDNNQVEKSKDTSPKNDTTENEPSAKYNNENVDSANVDSGNAKVVADSKIVGNGSKNVANHNANVASGNVDKVIDEKVCRKRVKKWVPMRKTVAKRNGHIEMSEDSSSQDSVNSDLPPPPILEDLEEHLPNYQIANLKTERQVAAMLDTVEPLEAHVEQDTEVVPMDPPHVPVFIELSVGQDSSLPDSEQPNDCLMVLESVQCDIDPTLMLEARAEDDECCEQIDIDDDDDDDNDVVIQTDVSTAADKVKKKPCTDPISLLTSSDEDDVILQEPHIDTLSVSDETDEDDLPLLKLVKREKKSTKSKRKRSETVKNILAGVADYFCMHCNHTSSSRSAHEKHLRTHSNSKLPSNTTATYVYQICKECGFTTSSKSQLQRHQKKHLNEKKYKCPICTYKSKYNMSLMYHLRTHDFDPNIYNCGACGLDLGCKKDLLTHQTVCAELGEKYMCGLCGFAAKTKRIMKIHKNTVHKHKV